MFAQKYGPWALIAGGSEGVGASFARLLAARGIDLLLLARREAPLAELARQLRGEFPVQVRTLAVDLCAPGAVAEIAAHSDDIEIGLLVYNAGSNTEFRDFLDSPPAYAEHVLDLNARTPMLLAHHFGTRMRSRGRGGIILVGSMAGYGGSGNLAVYTGAKAFSRIFAESLWYELKPHGVDVLGLILGATRTPAMARLGMVMDNPQMPVAEPAAVVQEGLEALGQGPLHIIGGEAGAHYISTLPREEAVALQSNAGRLLFPDG